MRFYVLALTLVLTAGLFGADNVLTPQEKAGGWVLLFDGKTLNGWDSVVPQGAGRGRGPGGGAGGAADPGCAEHRPGCGTVGKNAGHASAGI